MDEFDDIITKHLFCCSISNLYYYCRELGEEYVDKFVEYAIKDLEFLPALSKQTDSFSGYIPSLERLRIIYTKRKDYESAIKYCDIALEFYRKKSNFGWYEHILKKKFALENKRSK